ncbi:hypothetical protein [Lysobacter sp. yr284]|uniref:hypothetical protein n=1 Tax=Lysobacter sp. yr284 TaxID=1761791 RepID=UPI0011136E68|nr:hypothetical protein [Lysobacter sp. yr284]
MKVGYMRTALWAPAVALGLCAAAALPAAAQNVGAGKLALRDQSSLGLRAAAEQGLRKMMLEMSNGRAAAARLPDGFPIAAATYGDLRSVSLGAGFEVNTVDPAALMYANAAADLSRIARGTDTWKFVILSAGKPVGLLDMDRVDGRWQAVGAGASALAADLVAAAPATGDGSFRFVRIYQATSDLIEVRGAGERSRFVPMASARRSLALSAAAKNATGAEQALDSEDLLPALQAAVRGNLQRGQR